MAVVITPVWKRVGPELQASLAKYWIASGAMKDEARATERAKQAVCVASDEGRIVGVTTAYPRVAPSLRQPMYFLRMHVAQPARNQGLSIPFVKESFAEIERQELAKPKLICLGVILQLQNERLAAHYNEAYWWQSGFVYAGLTRDDQQLRVKYFKDARLGPPMQVKRKASAGA